MRRMVELRSPDVRDAAILCADHIRFDGAICVCDGRFKMIYLGRRTEGESVLRRALENTFSDLALFGEDEVKP